MPKQCVVTQKKTRSGNNVSHSHVKTKRIFKANIHKQRVYVPHLKKWVKLTISARGLKILQKKGADKVLPPNILA